MQIGCSEEGGRGGGGELHHGEGHLLRQVRGILTLVHKIFILIISQHI
jgi:hypothetical protein